MEDDHANLEFAFNLCCWGFRFASSCQQDFFSVAQSANLFFWLSCFSAAAAAARHTSATSAWATQRQKRSLGFVPDIQLRTVVCSTDTALYCRGKCGTLPADWLISLMRKKLGERVPSQSTLSSGWTETQFIALCLRSDQCVSWQLDCFFVCANNIFWLPSLSSLRALIAVSWWQIEFTPFRKRFFHFFCHWRLPDWNVFWNRNCALGPCVLFF